MNKRLKSNACLLGTAIIWGGAFVVQREGMGSVGPFMFSGVRMLMAVAVLLPLVIRDAKKKKDFDPGIVKSERKYMLLGGTCAGIVYFLAANLQQVGLVSVDAGKTAFITALYILLTPLVGIFLKQKINALNWIGAVIGVFGLYFLCITKEFTIERGDLIILIGALFWALHIQTIDHFTLKTPSVNLICMQSLVAGIISLIIGFTTETNTVQGIVENIPNLFYSGVISAGLAFTLQAMGQKHANPTTASIILSTEALFGAVCGFIFLHEVMSGRELLGCGLMMAAIIISQIPMPEKNKG